MNQINFDKLQGLVPAIIQDAATNEVLMLGFMNHAAYDCTRASGFVTFFSRTRQQLWTKGATSGNRLEIVSVTSDCDNDSLLFKVRVLGAGVVCHEGTRSCFTRKIDPPSLNASPARTCGAASIERSGQ